MAEPFKNFLNAALVRQAAAHLSRAWPGFDKARFVRLANTGLDGLELKARAMQICDALQATLPEDFAQAADIIEAALAPAPADDEPAVQAAMADDGLRGWVLWPVGEFIARRGLAHPARALASLHALTQRFTAEFALRPFIVAYPEESFATLARWCHDDSAHVRRLASEGSRPRLPWGLRLQALVADPAPALPLLRALQDDPSAYVRRSVANHLNDIAKDHPALVCEWVEMHLPGASASRTALLRHASRTLVKQGHPRMLHAWGLGAPMRGQATLTLEPASLRLGESFTFTLTLVARANRAQTLAIDYVVHHVKADGSTRPKVFKGWQVELPGRGELTLAKRHSMRVITTRRYHAGRHGLSVQVNGCEVARTDFDLLPA
jgi:3-methyladenine DNA glycosylase AlkC